MKHGRKEILNEERGERNSGLPFTESMIRCKEHGFRGQKAPVTNPNCATTGKVSGLLEKQSELVNFPLCHQPKATSSYGPHVHTTVTTGDSLQQF